MAEMVIPLRCHDNQFNLDVATKINGQEVSHSKVEISVSSKG